MSKEGLGSEIAATGTPLEVQWLGLCASTAGGTGSIPGRKTKIPHAAWCGRKKKKKQILQGIWKSLLTAKQRG